MMDFGKLRDFVESVAVERYGDVQVELVDTIKNGIPRKAIIIKGDSAVSPCIYVDGLDGMTYEGACYEVIETYDENKDGPEGLNDILDSLYKEDYILANAFLWLRPEGAYEPLKEAGFIVDKFHNMTVLYGVRLLDSLKYGSWISIKKDQLGHIGIELDKFKDSAVKNLKAEEFEVTDIVDKLSEMSKRVGEEMPMEVLEETRGNMYVVTNNCEYNGASVMMRDDILKKIYDEIGTYIILPSSVHEIIAAPLPDGMPVEAMAEMVRSVNAAVVPIDDVLSDTAYLYDGTITIIE